MYKYLFLLKVGRALAISALDVLGANPWSRIPASDFRSLKGIRQWLGVYIRSTHNPVQASKKIGRSKTKDDMYVFEVFPNSPIVILYFLWKLREISCVIF